MDGVSAHGARVDNKSESEGHTKYSRPSVRLVEALLCPLAVLVFVQPGFGQTNDSMPRMDRGGKKVAAMPSTAAKQAQMDRSAGETDIVYPSFTHMGMPDPVAHYALRLSGVATRNDDHTRGDFGFHLETGLAKKPGERRTKR